MHLQPHEVAESHSYINKRQTAILLALVSYHVNVVSVILHFN